MAKWGRKAKGDRALTAAATVLRDQQAPRNAIVAAANRLIPGPYGDLRIPTEQWTAEAWRQYDISGELRYAATWLGSALSRCRLLAADVGPGGDILQETSNAAVQALIAGFAGSPGKQAALLSAMGPYMTVPGECYVVAEIGPSGDFDSWSLVSNEEIKPGDNGYVIINDGGPSPRKVSLIDGGLVIRVHRPHPRKQYLADSPTRASLPVLREIEQLTKYEFAIMDSRLAGAGILLLPDDLDYPSPGDDIEPGESPFLALLAQAMMASIKDRGDARAVVPIVVQGPKDSLGTAQWLISPASALTGEAADLRDKAIRRLALSLDIPPEILLGLGGTNDWSSSQIEESAIKLHIEPVMTLICEAFTEGYLKPALESIGLDPAKFCVWFDHSRLVLRPNRATDAKDLYDRGELNGETLRYVTGFTEADAPVGKEKAALELFAIIKAAPRAGDALLPVLLDIFDIAKYVGQDAIDQVITSTGVDGTPPQAPAPPTNKPDTTVPPVPGVGGNGGGN